MKKIQLLEWGIITIGLIFGYKFFESFITSVVQVLYSFAGDGGLRDRLSDFLLPIVFMLIIYGVCFVLLIRRSGQIATYLSDKDNGNNDPLPIRIGEKGLLRVILISICLITILSNVPGMLLYLFESFKEKAGRYDPDAAAANPLQWHQFKADAIQVVIAAVAIFFSKDISKWFLRKKELDELVFESGTQNEQK
jgi:preprotein translocase subunit SecY